MLVSLWEHNRIYISEAFADKVIWITGASSGIGEGMVKAFAECGAKVICSARNVDELNRVKDECVAAGAEEGGLMVLPVMIEQGAGRIVGVSSMAGKIGVL